MGESRDTAAQVEAVRKRFPDSSYLAMVGISAGSGLLVTYLGKVNCILHIAIFRVVSTGGGQYSCAGGGFPLPSLRYYSRFQVFPP